ncbi:hypothetical protein GH733_009932, partial [Mirounga leonina]
MARLCLSLLFLVATVTLVSRGVHTWGRSKVVRKFQDIPETYVYVQQALWFAMKEYNKTSKDKYTFKVVKVLKSQEQMFLCTFIVATKPWKFEFTMLKKQCEE